MYQALTIANYFIAKGVKEGIPVSPMKLQKLVYFAHGWYLARTGTALVSDTIEAWKYGPVISELYRAFKSIGNGAIRLPYPVKDQPLTEDIQQFLAVIWDIYKGYSAIQLSNLTHVKESPWDTTLKPYIDSTWIPDNVVIDNALIKTYFEALIADDGQ